MRVEYEYDPAKNLRNIAERGLSFDLIASFDWVTATIDEDKRRDYGEPRFQAKGFIAERLYVVVFTWRDDVVRIISLRKANRREEKRYANQTKPRID